MEKKWHKSSEILPEDGQPCLIYVFGKHWVEERYLVTDIVLGVYSAEEKCWGDRRLLGADIEWGVNEILLWLPVELPNQEYLQDLLKEKANGF